MIVNIRLTLRATVLSLVFLLMPVIATSPPLPIGTTIFQIGTEDGTDQEFIGAGFPTDFICQARVDCRTGNFPRALVVPSKIYDYQGQNAVRVTIDFALVHSYQDLVLRLARGGVETLKVVVDGGQAYQVTSQMQGSNEGFKVGAYNLDLGAITQGDHSLTFTVVDDGTGSGSFQWDALALIAPSD